ncbi:MAG: hypothetical protein ACFKPT_25535 [Gloeotrichia echinulata GP01]|nr:hypothetical protein [Gloeotrichia echinulata DEX184]
MALEDKIKKHEEVIYTTAFSTAAMAIPGTFIPALDIGGIIGGWGTMLCIIAANSNRQLDKDTAMKVVTAIMAGAAGYLGGSKLFTFGLQFILPGIGTVGAVGFNSLLNFLYTIRLGRFVALQMEKPEFDTGDWASIIPEITSVVFAMPSVMEIREAWKDWTEKSHYKKD